MLAQSFSENSSSDGERRWPTNRTIESAEFSSWQPYKPLWRRKGFEVGEGSSRSGGVAIETNLVDDVDVLKEDDDDDDAWMLNDEDYDTDDLSVDVAKKSRWLRGFFEWLDSLSKDQIGDPAITMHCPACKGGTGENVWYRGFHAVVVHAEKVKSRRVKLHRKFAEILSGELKERKTRFLGSNQEVSLEWKGLEEEIDDHVIVWPPIVILQNTRSIKDETGKWLGLGREELPISINCYNIKKVTGAYGPAGHCGVTALIFESSEVGYAEAECLHKQFLKEGRGRCEWDKLRGRGRLHSSKERFLYGYMATGEDMELFNKHSKGKPICKFEMKSYKMMVIDPLKKMKANNSKLLGLEAKVAEEIEEKEILKKAYQNADEKLRLRYAEIQAIRRKANEKLEESKIEIDCLDNYYGKTIKELTDELEKLKMEHEELLQNSLKSSQKLQVREEEMEIIRQPASEELGESKDQIECLEKFYGDAIKKLTGDLERVKIEQNVVQASIHSLPGCSNEP